MDIKQRILHDIKSGELAFKNVQEIIQRAPYIGGKNKRAQKEAVAALNELEKSGELIKDRRRRYCTAKQAGAFFGTVQGTENGYAFILPDDRERYGGDFFVPRSSLYGAYDGDRVIAAPVKGTKDEAYVVKILKRGKRVLSGTFTLCGTEAIVRPDNARLPYVIIHPSLCADAKPDDKVMCEITAYREKRPPCGKIKEILGRSGRLDVEELSIIRGHSLREEFPQHVINEAQAVALKPVKCDGRRDLRGALIFTIDGADTRDIDDGVSLEVRGGKYILGVHIADVSHYVKPRTPLDNEAYARGTSVYFPDRVLPMLPGELSNGACSLNEGEDRLAMSCVMTFDKHGVRESYEVFGSVIKSRRKMTYTDVNAICAGDKAACEKYADIAGTVKLMQKLCTILAEKRDAAGCISLDIKEAKIYTENGKIVIPPVERGIAERLIEQFMISANEAVAEFLQAHKAPCLYRVHESPAPEKAAALITFLKDLGINAGLDAEDMKPKDFSDILKEAGNKPYFTVINKVMLRSMQKARYSEKNAGHFGLTSACYCHFTSPIRRYPDLFVHRALKAVLSDDIRALNALNAFAADAGRDCSDRERVADEAERETDDLYKVFYMTDRIGERYDAVISGVTKFGVFCELENTVEGFIPVEVMPDKRTEFFAEKFLLKGDRHTFRLGDKIKIRVDGCDFGKMRVMFSIDE